MIAQIDPAASAAPMNLGQIEKLTLALAESSAELDARMADYERELQSVNERHIKILKRVVSAVARDEAALHEAIEAAPQLFVKPRTLTLHGFKIGYTVSEGRLVVDDQALVMRLIEKHFAEQADALIRTTKEVNKEAVKMLEPEDIARLRCRIEDAGDQVIIKRAAGDFEKLLAKLKTKLVEAITGA